MCILKIDHIAARKVLENLNLATHVVQTIAEPNASTSFNNTHVAKDHHAIMC